MKAFQLFTLCIFISQISVAETIESPACELCPSCATPELQCPVCTCGRITFGSYGSVKVDTRTSYSCSKAHLPKIADDASTAPYAALQCPNECLADCGDTFHCCNETSTPPPKCEPCPECPTTSGPPPPAELQCPICTCTPIRAGSYGSLTEDTNARYSCSKAHLHQISGAVFLINAVSQCPTFCRAKCGDTYHCCEAPQEESCFPSFSRVMLENGKSVPMSELQIGDRVQTVSQGSVKYSEVTAFLQKQKDVLAPYKAVTTLSNDTITLSDRHLIYARSSINEKFNEKYTDELQIGNEVLVGENGQLKAVKVKEISNFVAQGAYVPLTDEGNIVVDGILASCYASFDHDLAHLTMTPMKWFPKFIELIFGNNNEIQGYVSIAKILGRYLIPNEHLYMSNI